MEAQYKAYEPKDIYRNRINWKKVKPEQIPELLLLAAQECQVESDVAALLKQAERASRISKSYIICRQAIMILRERIVDKNDLAVPVDFIESINDILYRLMTHQGFNYVPTKGINRGKSLKVYPKNLWQKTIDWRGVEEHNARYLMYAASKDCPVHKVNKLVKNLERALEVYGLEVLYFPLDNLKIEFLQAKKFELALADLKKEKKWPLIEVSKKSCAEFINAFTALETNFKNATKEEVFSNLQDMEQLLLMVSVSEMPLVVQKAVMQRPHILEYVKQNLLSEESIKL